MQGPQFPPCLHSVGIPPSLAVDPAFLLPVDPLGVPVYPVPIPLCQVPIPRNTFYPEFSVARSDKDQVGDLCCPSLASTMISQFSPSSLEHPACRLPSSYLSSIPWRLQFLLQMQGPLSPLYLQIILCLTATYLQDPFFPVPGDPLVWTGSS